MRIALLALVACGCRHASPSAAPPVAPTSADRDPVALPPGPGTVVIVLAPNVATPVVAGPFSIRSVNPSGDLEMALSMTKRCTGELLWFGYSGAGVAVGANQTLCVRSGASGARTQAFSGEVPRL